MVFDKQWFIKYQRILLWLLNTPVISIWFRWVFCIDGSKSSVGSRKISRILPSSILWVNKRSKGRIHLSEEFRTHDKFGKRLYYAFKPIWHLMHLWDGLFAERWAPQFDLAFSTLTQYPGSIGANNPVDGYVRRSVVAEDYATIRAGAGTHAVITDVEAVLWYINATAVADNYADNRRGIFCFDTAAIGAGQQVDSGTFSVWCKSPTKKDGYAGTPATHLAGATPAATNALATSDYGQCQTTTFGNIAYASVTADQYNDITLNTAGKAAVAMEGISKFSLQSSYDITATAPSWVSLEDTYIYGYFSDQTGTSNDPKLVVNYSVPSDDGAPWELAMMGVGR